MKLNKLNSIFIFSLVLILHFLIPYQFQELAGRPTITNGFVDIAQKVLDGVVHVKVEVVQNQNYYDPFEDFFYGKNPREMPRKALGFGSGVIISKDGYILTNNHVIEGASKIEVILNNRENYIARLIGADPSTDLALLKIEATDLTALKMGDSETAQIGQSVLAVGNPLNLTSTVTAGIISAKSRNINILKADPQRGVFPIESFIQTDAAVNPGNSGGALVDLKGEVIGVITAIASTTGAYSGYSFAVPAKIAKKVSEDLLKYGKVQRAFLGLQIAPINEELQKKYQLKNKLGVLVMRIEPRGGAANAGILEADVIKKIGNKDIKDLADLQEEISQYRPSDVVKVTILRKDKELVKEVTLYNLDGNTHLAKTDAEQQSLGAQFIPLTEAERNTFGFQGVKVTQIIKNGKVAQAGIREGFIVTHVNQKSIQDEKELHQILANTKENAVLLQGFYPNGVAKYYALVLR